MKVKKIRLSDYLLVDGGIARLRVHGEVKPDWSNIDESEKLDLAAIINGGICVNYSDAHYGNASNVIAPGRARKMCEGMSKLCANILHPISC